MSARLRAIVRGTNADLIREVAQVLPLGHRILDATYGKGNFWSPEMRNIIDEGGGYIVSNDLDPRCVDAHHHYDFRQFPKWWADEFPTVVFDPPYVSMGGRKTSTIPGMTDAFGMLDAPSTPQRLWSELIFPGVHECVRVCQPGGFVLVKCMDYVSSGELQLVLPHVLGLGPLVGAKVFDYWILDAGPGPQPTTNLDGTPRRQVHASHSGISFLVALRKGR